MPRQQVEYKTRKPRFTECLQCPDPSALYILYRPAANKPLSLFLLTPASGSSSQERIIVRVSYYESGSRTLPQAALQFNTYSDKYQFSKKKQRYSRNPKEPLNNATLSSLRIYKLIFGLVQENHRKMQPFIPLFYSLAPRICGFPCSVPSRCRCR